MQLNQPGLILCGVYAAFSLLLIWISYSIADIKSRVFFEQVTSSVPSCLSGLWALKRRLCSTRG